MFDINNFKIDEWRLAGLDWLAGKFELDGIELNGKYFNFNPKQKEFINAKERYCLFSGGRAGGKTIALLIKLILLSLFFPNNRILLGRNTLADIERVTLPDFFDLCPERMVDYNRKSGLIVFPNGSEILLMGLEALQSGPQAEIKKAEQKLKSLNLGGFFIDQVEEIEERVFTTLRGSLRRAMPIRQANFVSNPTNWWGYNFFKINPPKGFDKKNNKEVPLTRLVETSTFDNKENLSEDFIEDLMKVEDKDWIDKYVYGIWTETSPSAKRVFSEDLIKYLKFYLREPLRVEDGIEIYNERDNTKHYIIGLDPSDGSIDPCGIKVIEEETGREMASYSEFVPESVVADKALKMAEMFTTRKKPMMIIENNRSAVIELLKDKYDNFYEQEMFNYRERRKTKKLGWYSTWASKKLLITNFEKLLRDKLIKIHDKKTYTEMQNFIWTNEVRKKGAGANRGMHDDRLIATMLCYLNFSPKDDYLERLKRESEKIKVEKSKLNYKKYQYI